MGVLAAQGWYYQADFSNLAQATGRALSWSYLTMSQGGHLGMPGRTTFWVLNRLVPLNYPTTIVLRLAAQAAATVLLAKLLTLLVGRRTGVLAVLGLYAMSPLLVQGTLWLTASIGLLSSQLFVLLMLHAHVRYTLGGDVRWALATTGALFAATLCSEQAAVTALVLPILSVGFLHSGTTRERLRAALSRWPGWVMITASIVVFLTFFFAVGDYGDAAHGLRVYDAFRLVMVEWFASVIPALLGGPWVWLSGNTDNYLAVANPALWLRILCAMVVLVVIVVGVRRVGRIALAAWSMPLVTSAVGIIVVGVGRFQVLGVVIANLFEHAYYTAVPAALAITLSLWPTDPDSIRARLAREDPTPETETGRAEATALSAAGVVAILAVPAVLAVVAGSIGSGITYTARWAQSPARSYVTHLLADLGHARTPPALYDGPVGNVVIPAIEPAHSVSDVLALADQPGRTDTVVGPSPVVAGPDGRLRPARLFVAARVAGGRHSFCDHLIRGVGTWRLPLDRRPAAGAYYLRLNFFQQRLSTLEFSVVDADGHTVAPIAGRRTFMSINVGSIALRLPSTAPTAVLVRSDSRATNFCLVAADIGFGYAAGIR